VVSSRFSLLSVIIPTRGRPALLAEQLEAFAAQTYCGAWEVIVVDNGAVDETPDVVRAFTGRIPVRLVAAAQRRGASFARNCGADAALGDYLLFVDDDDRVTPGWLEAMASAAEHAHIIRGNDRFVHRGPDGNDTVTKPETEGLSSPFGFLPSISGCNSGIRKDVFDKVGGFNERYKRLEDTELFWRVQMAEDVLPVFVPDAVIEYRRRSGMRAVWKQSYDDSKAVPMLYRDFRKQGMPRHPWENLRGWTRIARWGPRWILSYEGREELAREAAWLIGRMVGSIHQRVLYL
jgi:glycosyltransferase involved in cell wall biosynthesis